VLAIRSLRPDESWAAYGTMSFMSRWDDVTARTVSEWAEAGRHGDAEAAFRLAAFGFERGQGETAEGWMALAARFGGSAMLWRLTDLVKDDSCGRLAARWQRQAILAEWGGAEVEVDESAYRIFSIKPDAYRTQEFGARVRGEPDEAVRSALIAAARRLMCVGDDGAEYPDAESAVDGAGYSPSHISDPQRHPGGGWQFWMDCKGEVFPLMAATQLRILVDELRGAGVTGIRIGPPG
jgi:hypothetical protein